MAAEGGQVIGSWRGLAIASTLAAVLWAIAVIDAARAPGPVDHAVVPGLDPAQIDELIWQRAGQPALRAVRAGDRWTLAGAGPSGAAIPADPAAIGEVLAALRGGRWHRRGQAPAEPSAPSLTVLAGGARHVVSLAAPIAGTEQRWLVVDGRGAVVDRWLARALDRDRLALQIRRPLAEAAAAPAITLRDRGAALLRLGGSPRRLVSPIALWLGPGLAGELERALRDLVVVRIPDGPSGARGLAIELPAAGGRDPVTVALGGACPGAPELVAMSGSAGDGCVARGAADAVSGAVARLRGSPAEIVERRPIAFEPHRITLGDGAVLELAPPRIADAAADPVRVAELLAALAAPADVAPLPAGAPSGQLVVADRAGLAVTIDLYPLHPLYPRRVLARRGEPIALAPAPGAWALLGRASRELRDRTLWREEPTTIAVIDIDGVRYRRGAVIGAWTREPAGQADAPSGGAGSRVGSDAMSGAGSDAKPGVASDAKPGAGRDARPGAGSDAKPGASSDATLEALATQLAAPTAIGWLDAQFAVVHRVTATVEPPAGPPVQHALELGAPGPAGCPARAAFLRARLPAGLCRDVAALAARAAR